MKAGWSEGEEFRKIRRTEAAPERFVREAVPADPACPAWNEPGYEDPDLRHTHLPLGARYWQGFAKRCDPGKREARRPWWIPAALFRR